MNQQELESIRQARLNDLKTESNPEQTEQTKQQEEMRHSVLSQVLTPEARERLSRVAMVRPERAQQAEEILLRMATSGQLRGKVDEPQLVDLLERISGATQQPQKVTVLRRNDDSDDDLIVQPQSNNAADDDDDFFD